MNGIQDADLRVFVDAVKTYFTNITGQTADGRFRCPRAFAAMRPSRSRGAPGPS